MRIVGYTILALLGGCMETAATPDDVSPATDQSAAPDARLDAQSQDTTTSPDRSGGDAGSEAGPGGDTGPQGDATPLDVPSAADALALLDGRGEDLLDVFIERSDAAQDRLDVPPSVEVGAEDAGDAAGDVMADRADTPGQIYCPTGDGGVSLTNPNRDPVNCGGCGRRCCGGFCLGGRCTADGPPGTAACPLSEEEERLRGCFGDVQVRPAIDPENCGGCGLRCSAGQVCRDGTCQ